MAERNVTASKAAAWLTPKFIILAIVIIAALLWSRHTKVSDALAIREPASGKWKTFFVVENQTFQVGMDWLSRAEARWYRKMIAIALWRMTREGK